MSCAGYFGRPKRRAVPIFSNDVAFSTIPMKSVANELFATLNLLNFPFLFPSFNLYSYNFNLTKSYYPQPVRLPYNFSQIPPTNSSQIHAIPYNFNITPTATNIPPTNAQMQMGICAWYSSFLIFWFNLLSSSATSISMRAPPSVSSSGARVAAAAVCGSHSWCSTSSWFISVWTRTSSQRKKHFNCKIAKQIKWIAQGCRSMKIV